MTTIILLLAALVLFFISVMIIDCNRFVIKEYNCRTQKLKKDETIILLADLHNKSYGTDNARLIAAIEKIKPDRILIAGDMYTCSKNTNAETALKLIGALAQKFSVYYCNGNHEQKTQLLPEQFGTIYSEYVEELRNKGVCFLNDARISLPAVNMDIYGLSIEKRFYGKWKREQMERSYLTKRLGDANSDAFSVLIAHNPDYFDAYTQWGADLVVSGHIHGGLMKLPALGGVISPALKLFPRYDGGEFLKNQTKMILSRGLGTHTIPIRIFNPGELVVIHCGKI